MGLVRIFPTHSPQCRKGAVTRQDLLARTCSRCPRVAECSARKRHCSASREASF
ncbi:hypothetical protein PCLA_15r0143 [Pseudomonas citronellolis]|nr:hypothetical protein PCLA_15r0143 [Pseudomonas citronellolis]